MYMRNVTICIPEETHARARLWASEHDISLSFLVASILDTLPNIQAIEARVNARKQFAAMRKCTGSRAPFPLPTPPKK